VRTRGLAVAIAFGVTLALLGASDVKPAPVASAVPSRFACYPSQFSAYKPQTRTIVDAFSKLTTVTLAAPVSVCAPAPGLSAAYLTCFRTKIGASRFRSRTITLSDEWVKRFPVTLFRLQTVCAPTARVDAGSSSPAKGIDLFACYTSRSNVSSLDKVDISDAFGKSSDEIGAPYQLCASATVRGRQQFEPRRLIGCYSANSKTKGGTIIVRNEFSYLKAILGPRYQVCTAATTS
jgi:hypothetical protein